MRVIEKKTVRRSARIATATNGGVDTSPYEKLKMMILDGAFAAGEPLAERPLAEVLGVSRTPVRESIFRLEREGLVRMVEGKGAFVAAYSIEDMIEIYQMREGLEPLAARLSCMHLADGDLDHHERLLRRYRASPAMRLDDPGAWRRLGRDFHNLFILASRNARLIRAVAGMQSQVELFRGLGRNIVPQVEFKSAVEEHWDILQALRARNASRAEKAVRVHLQNGLRSRLDALHSLRR